MNSIRTALLIAAGLLFTVASAQQSSAGTFSQIGTSRWVEVSYVYDGDTFKTEQGEKVRLLGINTPERAHGATPGQPLATKATSRLKSMLLKRTVRLVFDKERKDRYGRLLAHVYLRSGEWVNGAMVESGMAHAYTFAPNFRYSSELLTLEQQARKAKRGMWRSDRFRLLTADKISKKHIGQFRVISGRASAISKWQFKMGNLTISVPRAHRKWFDDTLTLKSGDFVTVHGKIRLSSRGRLFLALHSPYDLEINPEIGLEANKR